MENLIKSQKEKLVELQEYLRVKEADLEKVAINQRYYKCVGIICMCMYSLRSCLVTQKTSWNRLQLHCSTLKRSYIAL